MQNKIFKVALSQNHILMGADDASMQNNVNEIASNYQIANSKNCDLVLTSELSITGYNLGDLMSRADIIEQSKNAQDLLLQKIKNNRSEKNTALVFGNFSTIKNLAATNKNISLEDFALLNGLQVGENTLVNYAQIFDPQNDLGQHEYAIKKHLPNWGVFDETRWFASHKKVADPVVINGIKVGVCVCLDIWIEDTTRELVEKGAQIIVVPNASPYANARHKERIKVVSDYAKKYHIPIAYVNMISACDEVVFDGGSFAVNAQGKVIAQAIRFEKDLLIVDIEIDTQNPPHIPKKNDTDQIDVYNKNVDGAYDIADMYSACKLGLREFINSVSGAKGRVVVGLSGGIDSALVATLAVDAFGADRVHGVLMPSKYTSQESNDYAICLATNLGISHETFPITQLHDVAENVFGLSSMDSVVSENIQSRFRGNTLMMLSNSRGWLPLATGNKSEIAVGYYTLYGDSVGAFAPIKDVYKTQVFELCNYRNACVDFEITSPIPQEIIDRPPSAELREGQKDSDSLPEYKILDTILFEYIEQQKSLEEIIALGFESKVVEKVIALIKNSEFKRKQSPIGTRLSRHNFGLCRRVPICAKS